MIDQVEEHLRRPGEAKAKVPIRFLELRPPNDEPREQQSEAEDEDDAGIKKRVDDGRAEFAERAGVQRERRQDIAESSGADPGGDQAAVKWRQCAAARGQSLGERFAGAEVVGELGGDGT